MRSKEQAVRDTAMALHTAILAARETGLSVQWPHRAEDLPAIAISETKKAAVTVVVNTSEAVSADVTAKAGVAAQKAADKVVDKAAASS